ncbi:hypothetical protein HZH68_003440 [Vespula germanica]|uniref:Uncharacterized protein n=1 Tax=Vespula germanica TaxID=30212 RepID=A0A834NP27_VESGE|nr:hypothetical protein HZH68_003440 [Vespula germanica]
MQGGGFFRGRKCLERVVKEEEGSEVVQRVEDKVEEEEEEKEEKREEEKETMCSVGEGDRCTGPAAHDNDA